MNTKIYNFNPKDAYEEIKRQWTNWATAIKANKWVVCISGGKDSTIVAALACKIFGNENVVGVTIPCGVQADINDSLEVIKFCNIKHVNINIEDSFCSIINGVENNGITPTEQAKVNVRPRLRMTVGYAVAQSVNGILLNTCNLSEDTCGYSTLFGDTCGSYAPLQDLTVTEILALGDWLGIPYHLVHKVPADGLQSLTDEDNLGFKYADLDKYIRYNIGTDEFKNKILKRYYTNKFKTDMIHIEHPVFNFPNYIKEV